MQFLKCLFLFLSIATVTSSLKHPDAVSATRWISLPDVSRNLEKEQRPVLIDLYTNWCGWCKVMDKETYADKRVGEYLAKKFYPVKINAEQKQQITWNGKKYNFNASYNTHDFAIFLTGGQLSYPTTVIIPADGQPQAIPGFLKPKEMEVVLKYFAEGAYGKISFPEYHRKFKSSW